MNLDISNTDFLKHVIHLLLITIDSIDIMACLKTKFDLFHQFTFMHLLYDLH